MCISDIAKKTLIDPSALDSSDYFNSLIGAAISAGALNDGDVNRLRLGCFSLAEKRTSAFTGYKSSSVSLDRAERVIASNNYTIGLYLKSLATPDAAVEALRTQSVADLYKKGRLRNEKLVQSACFIYGRLRDCLIDTDNITYNDTLNGGLRGFFRRYDADFAAHDMIIGCDYPAAVPIKGLAGAEHIVKYIEALHYENIFCTAFERGAPDRLLHALYPDSRYQIVNILLPALNCAVGCLLSGGDLLNLRLTPVQTERAYFSLEGKSRDEIAEIVVRAAVSVCERLRLNGTALLSYLKKAARSCADEIYFAVENETPERVFVNAAERAPRLKPSSVPKMSDSRYRALLAAIERLTSAEEKAALIQTWVHSHYDLADLLCDAVLTDDEYSAALTLRGDGELAALTKLYGIGPSLCSDDPKGTRFCAFLSALPARRRLAILQTAGRIED